MQHDKIIGKFRIVCKSDQTVEIDYAVLTGNQAPGTMVRRQTLFIPSQELKDLHEALGQVLAEREAQDSTRVVRGPWGAL